jgi:hypothetical protein
MDLVDFNILICVILCKILMQYNVRGDIECTHSYTPDVMQHDVNIPHLVYRYLGANL